MVVLVAALAGCAARQPPTVPVPSVEDGRVSLAARAVAPTGTVQPVAIGVTNGRAEPLALDPRQLYALDDAGKRVAPVPPAEAARRAGGRHLPGAVRGGAVGVVTGGVFGAIGGLIAGAIRGGIGAAVATGSAVGATLGAITGVVGGRARGAPDVAGFTDRALPSTTLAPGLSATGYVYYPAGTYRTLELLIADEHGGAPLRTRAPIEAAR